MPHYPHLIVPFEADTSRFTSTRSGRQNFATPPRNRAAHARGLLQSIRAAAAGVNQNQQIGNGFYQVNNLTLTFASDPEFPLAFESLDLPRSGINLLAVSKDDQGRTLATIRVPQNKLGLLIKKLEAYRDKAPGRQLAEGEKKGRDNRKLVESIGAIQRATLRELWTDSAQDYPAPNTPTVLEVWLLRSAEGQPAADLALRGAQEDFGFEVLTRQALDFIDRSVVLVRATIEQLSRGVEILGIIAEVRKAKTTAAYFDALPVDKQHAHITNLAGRLTVPPEGCPVVSLLDTGVNHAHPLLAPLIDDADVHTHNPAWGANDSWPHGTGMAGLALLGDLTPHFIGEHDVEVLHRLESMKLIQRNDPHPEHLFGAVTIEGISRLEAGRQRNRVFCMAITTDGKDKGRPTSWSAALDNLAAGAINDTHRLVLVSAGNASDAANYPNDNMTSSVQDPAQSWNALTIGGTTDRVIIDEQNNPGLTPLAERGDIAPASTTSLIWPTSPKWPFKPDIVLEAANMGRAQNIQPMYLPELSLLTTSDEFIVGRPPLTTFYETSAATALAAGMAASLWARYPTFTPETIRALMVHASRWTPAMIRRCTDRNGSLNVRNMLRTFGYGCPDPTRLIASANNELTLIVQDRLRPFIKEETAIKTRDLNVHRLPWPAEVLRDLPVNTEVKLRVTLSYFVEPSPGERGWDKKYGYASHGLRFAVQRPTETVREFKARINAYGRDENYDADAHENDAGTWTLGTSPPSNGSIHSNIWTGTAAQLANRSHIAVYPTLGWWRTRPGEQRYDNWANYSLIVSIETPDVQTDIYTPVAVEIGIEVPVEIEV